MNATALPQALQPHLQGYASSGENFRTASSASVFHWTRATQQHLFLKIHDRSAAPYEPGLYPEAQAMAWLQGKLSVPRVVCYHVAGEVEYLLTTQVPGAAGHSHQAKQDVPALVREFARGLRAIHALPYRDCPLDRRLARFFPWAEGLIGRMGDDELVEEMTRADLAAEIADLRANAPAAEDLVFVHGDYCLPNILVDGGHPTGFIDWGYAGIGDRYLDFVAADHTIGRNLGPEWKAPFFAEYGLDALDEEKLAYYRRVYSIFE